MATFFVPAPLRALTDGVDRFEVQGGGTLRDVLERLRADAPRLVDRIMHDNDLRPDIAVALDGTILDGAELFQPVGDDAEIYVVPPLGGG